MRARSGCGRFPFVPGHIATIAGADAPYRGWFGTGVVIVLTFPDLHPLCHAYANRVTTFPHLPGLFGFRELPVIMAAFEKLSCLPDIFLLDGNGYAHPRRFGYSWQAGVVLGIPTIGVAKRPLIGKYTLPGQIRGSTSEMTDDGEVIGMAVKTQTGVRPVFVSDGYRTDLDGAVRITLAAGGRHRSLNHSGWPTFLHDVTATFFSQNDLKLHHLLPRRGASTGWHPASGSTKPVHFFQRVIAIPFVRDIP